MDKLGGLSDERKRIKEKSLSGFELTYRPSYSKSTILTTLPLTSSMSVDNLYKANIYKKWFFSGDSLYEPGVGIELLSAMKKISENKTENATKTESVAMSKSIKVGNSHGVDVYLLVDVSKSITVEKLNLTKWFLDALLPGVCRKFCTRKTFF